MLGYSATRSPDGGNARFFKVQGKITTTLSPEGNPIVTGEGTGSLIKGTGKYEGFQGSGTFKLHSIAEGISVMDYEYDLTKK